jgi:hypothetical protein
MPVPEAEYHSYLSTACLHGRHDYCAAVVGSQGPKLPATCKFCEAECICACHEDDSPSPLDT